MATFLENKERNVIPNFRTLEQTALAGELDSPSFSANHFESASLEVSITEWRHQEHTLGLAADLLSASIVTGDVDHEEVAEASSFITEYSGTVSEILREHVRASLDHKLKGAQSTGRIDNLDKFKTGSELAIRQQIGQLRKRISNLPHNSIAYVEIARLYTVLGHRARALHNLQIAVALAPSSRYVLRAFARVMAHYGEAEHALFTIRKLGNLHDPWILATEIALTTLIGQTSRYMKRGLLAVANDKFSLFSKGELASSLATVELREGAYKKGRKLFHQSLLDPNDNVLAQAEWAATKVALPELESHRFDVRHKEEAIALASFHKNDWKECIAAAETWFLDMPFIKRPLLLGAHVAFYFNDDPGKAASFTEAGLMAHPDDATLLNNLAFFLSEINQLDRAQAFLSRGLAVSGVEPSTKICLTATEGLLAYRRGDREEGEHKYLEAIKQATEAKNLYLAKLAFLNFVREEFGYSGKLPEGLKEKVSEMETDRQELSLLKAKVLRSIDQASSVPPLASR